MKKGKFKFKIKHFIAIALLAWIGYGIYGMFNKEEVKVVNLDYSEFYQQVEKGNVESVAIVGRDISYELKDNAKGETRIPDTGHSEITNILLQKNVKIVAEKDWGNSIYSWASLLLFPLILVVIIVVMIKSQKKGGAFGFGKNKAKLVTPENNKVTFDDVAGNEEAKAEVKELSDFLKEPQKYEKMGANIPRGILLLGPPGTGKTMLAKALASEAKVPFFTISGSDFVEMFVGVGASRIRAMFEEAKLHSPSILFIDEIDAVGKARNSGGQGGGGNDEREQTLNQLLVEMDGFNKDETVLVIAATNRADVLDPALLRPGRFDRHVTVNLPDSKGREQILKSHSKTKPISANVDWKSVASGTPGFSGADLANLLNEAALFAARLGRKEIVMKDIEEAKDKILMGASRSNTAMSQKEKERTAYHEAGHAIVSESMGESHDKVYKISIIPRGRALGVTQYLPAEDKYSQTKKEMIAHICSLYGGRVAEEIIYGQDEVTSGASNDIERATELAERMVKRWGFGKQGFLLFSNKENGTAFDGAARSLSDKLKTELEEEVRVLTTESYNRAKEILENKKDKLEIVTKALMKFETITGRQFEMIMNSSEVTLETLDLLEDPIEIEVVVEETSIK